MLTQKGGGAESPTDMLQLTRGRWDDKRLHIVSILYLTYNYFFKGPDILRRPFIL